MKELDHRIWSFTDVLDALTGQGEVIEAQEDDIKEFRQHVKVVLARAVAMDAVAGDPNKALDYVVKEILTKLEACLPVCVRCGALLVKEECADIQPSARVCAHCVE